MLNYLQGLLSNQQQQSQNQFGQNLGLQGQELTQQGQQFDKNLAFQQQQLGQQGSEFARQQQLAELEAQRQNELAQQNFGLTKQGQLFNQGESTRLNVTPGSTIWDQMQQITNPNSVFNLAAAANLNRQNATQAPISKVNFKPAGLEWRLS